MSNLFIQTAFIGDLFLSIPSLKRVKKLFPDEELVLFCRAGLGALFKELGLIDSYIEINKNTGGWAESQSELQKCKYNLIISMHQSFRTALIVSKLSANKKVGYSKWWNFWAYDQRIERPMLWPEALRQLKLIATLDSDLAGKVNSLEHEKIFFNSNTQADILSARSIPEWASCNISDRLSNVGSTIEKFKLPSSFFVVSPGSVWPTKRWTEEGFKKLIEKLEKPVVLTGSPAERPLCEKIKANRDQVFNLSGETTLLETLHLMSHAELVVSNDSGAQHMAAAVQTPIVSVFGPTTLELGYRPWFEKLKVAELDLTCRPCGKHGAKSCPLGTHECMEKLTSDYVLQQVKSLL